MRYLKKGKADPSFVFACGLVLEKTLPIPAVANLALPDQRHG